jgi:uncharacterized protein (TIRG00374 family)
LNNKGEPVSLPEISEEGVPQPKKQNIWVKVLFLLINIAVIAILVYAEKNKAGTIPSLRETVASVHNGWKYIIIAACMFFVMIVAESACYSYMMWLTNKKAKPFIGLKTALVGRYYDNVTPFATGGQPFQIFTLKRGGLDTATACSIPLIRHSVKMIAVNALVIIAFICIPCNISPAFKIAAFFGVAVNLVGPAFIILVSLNKKLAFSIVRFGVKIGCKIRLIKNYDKTVDKIVNMTDSLVTTLRFLVTHLSMMELISILSIIDVLALISVPYFVLRGFGIEVGYFDVIVRGLYAMNAASYIPTPGASGGAEAYFFGVFGDLFQTGSFFWGVMLWRLVTYYIFLLIGTIINIALVIKTSIKTGRYNRKIKVLLTEIEQLEAETGLHHKEVSGDIVEELPHQEDSND